MLHRKSLLRNFRYYLKSIHGLWIPAVGFIDIFIPLLSLLIYKTNAPDAVDSLVQQFMFFFIPIFSVWTCVFVGELFFSEKTKDVFFFYSLKKKFKVIVSFFLIFLVDATAIIFLHSYCLEDVCLVAVKLFCVMVFYFGIAAAVLKASKSASITIMVLLIYSLMNALPIISFDFFLFYDTAEGLSFMMFLIRYLPLLVFGILISVFVFTESKKKTSEKVN